MSWIPESGIFPEVGNGNPLQYSCHGQKGLVGCIPWGHKQLDMTESSYTHTHTHTHAHTHKVVLNDIMESMKPGTVVKHDWRRETHL